MTTQTEQLQQLWKEYERIHDHEAASSRAVVEWAVKAGKLDVPPVDPLDVLAGKMSRALREETAFDAEGREYRLNHAVRIMKDGVQTTFWSILGYAPRSHMEKAFTQRREQIIGDCVQLRVDVDVFNNLNPAEEPIQLELNFTDDVDERLVFLQPVGGSGLNA